MGKMLSSPRTIGFNLKDNGNSGTSMNLDLTASNKQKITLTGNVTFTFTDPRAACGITLLLVQDAGGTNTVAWPANVLWDGGSAPTISAGANDISIVTLFFDGTNYYGEGGTQDYS